MKYYTGVGSRETPTHILELMNKIAVRLEGLGYTLRSGGADGADSAFAQGVDNKVVYIPWNGFNNIYDRQNNNIEAGVTEEALQLASELHPAWERCSQGARKLHARNMYQVIGKDMVTPSEFLICYTKNGKRVGGTATAIKLAETYEVPVFNLGLQADYERLTAFIKDTK